MHLELTEILVCPDCGPGHGLIAFVDRMEERRIVQGRLDCPMCERRHEIAGGTVYLARMPEEEPPGDPPTREAPAGGSEPPPQAAAMAMALLGPPEKGEVLLVMGAAPGLASGIAEERLDAAVVSYEPPPGASGDVRVHPRVYPVVSPTATDTGAAHGSGLPFRAGVLDGAVCFGIEAPARLEQVAEALSAGGRLVVLSPSPAARASLARLQGIEELAADARAWVGSRP